MVSRPRINDSVEETLDEIKAEHDYPTLNEAIRHALREAGYE